MPRPMPDVFQHNILLKLRLPIRALPEHVLILLPLKPHAIPPDNPTLLNHHNILHLHKMYLTLPNMHNIIHTMFNVC